MLFCHVCGFWNLLQLPPLQLTVKFFCCLFYHYKIGSAKFVVASMEIPQATKLIWCLSVTHCSLLWFIYLSITIELGWGEFSVTTEQTKKFQRNHFNLEELSVMSMKFDTCDAVQWRSAAGLSFYTRLHLSSVYPSTPQNKLQTYYHLT